MGRDGEGEGADGTGSGKDGPSDGTGSGKDGQSSPQSKAMPEIEENMKESLRSPAKQLENQGCLAGIMKRFTSPVKQLTLAKALENQGSPVDIIKRSSPGAKVMPSLFEVLSGKVIEDEAKAKAEAKKYVVLEGVSGENISKEPVKNGSRDR